MARLPRRTALAPSARYRGHKWLTLAEAFSQADNNTSTMLIKWATHRPDANVEYHHEHLPLKKQLRDFILTQAAAPKPTGLAETLMGLDVHSMGIIATEADKLALYVTKVAKARLDPDSRAPNNHPPDRPQQPSP